MTNYSISSPPMATAVPIVPLQPKSSADTYYAQTTTTTNKATAGTKAGISREREDIITRNRDPLNEDQIQQLMDQGYTRGLATSMNAMLDAFALRIWIVDNSGSMQRPDGHRIVAMPGSSKGNRSVKMVPCSRWEEITECVEYHIQMAGLVQAPTQFRFLNPPGAHVGPQQFTVATGATDKDSIRRDVHNATSLIRRARPGGCTPLTSHILEISSELAQMAPTLRRLGRKVVLVIATDGLPTDERGYNGRSCNREFVEALRMLEGYPVWVVIRLCTDEEEVVDFYNELDDQLELSLEVLDDFTGEAVEVTDENPWLNYALPLHRLREMGYHDRVFDMLDERLLTKSELRDFLRLLFGTKDFDGVPDPSLEWTTFMSDVSRILKAESSQYDPVKRKLKSWISTKRLNRSYNPNPFAFCLPR